MSLMIAAASELAGLTLLHCDEDYDRIVRVTRRTAEGVAPAGSPAQPAGSHGGG